MFSAIHKLTIFSFIVCGACFGHLQTENVIEAFNIQSLEGKIMKLFLLSKLKGKMIFLLLFSKYLTSFYCSCFGVTLQKMFVLLKIIIHLKVHTL